MIVEAKMSRVAAKPIEYEELLGEREFLTSRAGGEEAYRLWCWSLMFWPGDGSSPFDVGITP
jgi:hypothetical protein